MEIPNIDIKKNSIEKKSRKSEMIITIPTKQSK